MKVMVTGKNGQLGSELQVLAGDYPGHSFTFTDVAELDITQPEAVANYFETHNFDALINCAAYTAVDKAEEEPEKAFAVNAEGVATLVAACGKHDIKLIHISTDYVFDGKATRPFKETDRINPLGVYGRSKRKGEEYILASDLQAVIIRTSWLYSSFGNNFVKTMLRLGKERDTIKVVVDQVGSPTYARDLADACLKVLEQHEKWTSHPEVYHYANAGRCSWYAFAKAIFKIRGVACEVIPISTEAYPTAAKRPGYSVLDRALFKNKFEIKDSNWELSLRKAIDSIKANQTNKK